MNTPPTFEALQQAWSTQQVQLNGLKLQLDANRSLPNLQPGPLSLAFSLGCMALLLAYCLQQWGEWRYFFAGLLLLVWTALTLGAALIEKQRLQALDFTQPVLSLQQSLASAKLRRLAQLRWAFITGHVLWCVPFFVVLMKGLVGAPLLDGDGLTVMAWAAFWTAVPIPFELALMRWAGRRWQGRAGWTRITDALAGDDIAALRALLVRLRD
jgi:hypothetical protein